MIPIILASASERRKELLFQLIGDNFQVCVSSYVEKQDPQLKVTGLVTQHSEGKAKDISTNFKEGIIISADTVIECQGKILGKPASREEAKEMLQTISGRKITAVTGLTVMDITSRKIITETELTDVWIRDMPESFIDTYLSTGEPMGKAGALAIQGRGAVIVEKIEGDFFNVVGLPLYLLSRMLEEFGIEVLKVFK
ncbi:MAG: Maf family nucleotide pyrophosphatase [Methanolobus sp.]